MVAVPAIDLRLARLALDIIEVGRGRIGREEEVELDDMRGWVEEVWDWEEGGGVSGKGSGLGVDDERSGMEPNELLLSRGLPVP